MKRDKFASWGNSASKYIWGTSKIMKPRLKKKKLCVLHAVNKGGRKEKGKRRGEKGEEEKKQAEE